GRTAGTRVRIKGKLLPTTRACAPSVSRRRRNQEGFADVAGKLRPLLTRCSLGKIDNESFWQAFWKMYRTPPPWRLQGRGLEISGKHAPWRQACGALVRILEAGKVAPNNQLDALVASEIDRLAKIPRNSARGAWLSEMLCHYFPQRYPVNNGPVHKWWLYNKLHFRRSATEGQKYVELSKKLRWVLRKYHPAGARDLAELDAAIWCCLEERGLLKNRST